jgi:hypothetical protein
MLLPCFYATHWACVWTSSKRIFWSGEVVFPGFFLVLHDDPKREYAYGPAEGLSDTKIGTFSKTLMVDAKQRGWVVISMKKDFKKIFVWE